MFNYSSSKLNLLIGNFGNYFKIILSIINLNEHACDTTNRCRNSVQKICLASVFRTNCTRQHVFCTTENGYYLIKTVRKKVQKWVSKGIHVVSNEIANRATYFSPFLSHLYFSHQKWITSLCTCRFGKYFHQRVSRDSLSSLFRCIKISVEELSGRVSDMLK